MSEGLTSSEGQQDQEEPGKKPFEVQTHGELLPFADMTEALFNELTEQLNKVSVRLQAATNALEQGMFNVNDPSARAEREARIVDLEREHNEIEADLAQIRAILGKR